MTLPRAAGFCAEFKVMSPLYACAWPCPDTSAVKIPGAAATTGSVIGGDVTPFTSATSCVVVFPATAYGTITELYDADVNTIGAGVPSNRNRVDATRVATRPFVSS